MQKDALRRYSETIPASPPAVRFADYSTSRVGLFASSLLGRLHNLKSSEQPNKSSLRVKKIAERKIGIEQQQKKS